MREKREEMFSSGQTSANSGHRLNAMTATQLLRDIPHVTPVACPSCSGGQAHLTRRGPDAFKRDGKSEIWIFRCNGCGQEFSQSVEN
jgi:hypothetical protein